MPEGDSECNTHLSPAHAAFVSRIGPGGGQTGGGEGTRLLRVAASQAEQESSSNNNNTSPAAAAAMTTNMYRVGGERNDEPERDHFPFVSFEFVVICRSSLNGNHWLPGNGTMGTTFLKS